MYEEGALIFPAVQVQRGYETIEDIVRMCRMRIRVPDQWWGDFLAMLGAARVGERELLALAEEAGWETLDRFSAEWFDYSERRMVVALEGLPAGSLTVASTHDPIPGAPEGVTVKVAVRVDPAASRIEVDLRDNGDSLPFGLNMSEACARTSAMVGIFNALPHTVPPNAGAFRRIDVKLRRGCVVGIPGAPDFLLGGHHQRRRPHRQRRAARDCRAWRRPRHGRGRRRDSAELRRDFGHGSAQRRRPS